MTWVTAPQTGAVTTFASKGSAKAGSAGHINSLFAASLATLLDDVVRRWKPSPRQWLIGSSDDATVLADRERLVLALDAIIEDAVGFTGDGDTIQLTVHCDGQQAAIVVADSGPGIPDSHLASVFEGFSGSALRGSGPRNFGLGLSIVRAVAEAHGGHVRAERGPLGGAAVSLSLPLHKPVVPAGPTSERIAHIAGAPEVTVERQGQS